jgi:hypothetical protein
MRRWTRVSAAENHCVAPLISAVHGRLTRRLIRHYVWQEIAPDR